MYSVSRCNNQYLRCAGRQTTLYLRDRSIGPRCEKFGKVGTDLWPWYRVCTKEIFIPKGSYGEWRDQKCIPLVGAITTLTCAGRHNYSGSQVSQYRAQNGKFGKLGRTYGHGTVFAPRKYLYQKEATGMERPEMYSVSRCNNPT